MVSRLVQMARIVGVLASVVAVAAAACGGPENIELVGVFDDADGGIDQTTPNDGVPDEGVDEGVPAGDAEQGTDATRDVEVADGSDAQCMRAASACLAYGTKCVEGIECCSGRCEQSVCLQAGTCSAPGASCSARSECCSGFCEDHKCLNYCKADGAPCTSAHDCCSLACNSGVCGGRLCWTDEGCSTNSDCCSNLCDQGHCRSASSCGLAGAVCANGGAGCCGGKCFTKADGDDSRCDVGPGPCRPPGMPCTAAADCCAPATCTQNASGYSFCTMACRADGQACASAAECCGKVCTGNPPVCASAAPVCSLIGTACSGDGQCCSGQCLGTKCGNNCAPE